MTSTYLTRTPSQAGSATKGTFSAWVKRGNVSTGYPRLFHQTPSSNNYLEIFFSNGDELQVDCTFNSSVRAAVRTNRKFRDPNSFYHIMISIDSTQSTASDRIKFYVNGVQETSFAATTYPGSGDNMKINGSTGTVYIGQSGANSEYFDGSMSHVHWIDGTAYTPSAFGETDATTGEWKIKTSPSVTYGTNGFFILKDGNTITDSSTNSNNFSLGGGTLTKTEDCPSNVFATWNGLGINKANVNQGAILDYGNTRINTDNRTDFKWFTTFGTLGATSGKYYMEVFVNQRGTASGVDFATIGIINDFAMSDTITGTYGRDYSNWGSGVYAYEYVFNSTTSSSIKKFKRENGSNTGGNSSWVANIGNTDVVMMAWDLDNGKIWFGKNGTWYDSGNPSSGSNEALAFTPSDRTFLPMINHWIHNSGSEPIFSANFGNGFFGTTAIGSAGTNASGNGIFEYDVPTGFTALSTKGLNL